MKKFAFIMISPFFDPEKNRAIFTAEGRESHIYYAKDYEAAKKLVVDLYHDGFRGIELCSAFGREKTRELMELTDNKMAIGYIVFDPENAEAYREFFGRELAETITGK